MPVTLKQIAKASGLSMPTVSQILNGKGWYREETREKVLETARRLGYMPNTSARAVATGRFNCIALLASTFAYRSSMPGAMLDGIQNALALRRQHLALAKLPDEDLTDEDVLPRMLREWMADGMLVNYNAFVPRRLQELVSRHKLPSVWINYANEEVSHVCPDDFAAGRLATEHLLQHGHRRVAYVDFSHDIDDHRNHYSAAERREGFQQAARAAGAEASLLCRNLGLAAREKACQEFLRGEDRPEAIVTYGLDGAMVLYLSARASGMAVPNELSIVALDGRPCPIADFTSVELPWEQIGSAAVQGVLERVENRDMPALALRLPGVIHRGTTVS